VSTEKWVTPAEGRENDAWRVVLVALVLVGIVAALVMGALGALGGPAAEVEEDTSKDGQGPAVTPAEVGPAGVPGSLRVPRDQGLTDSG
jgi:hypothetical protein